MSLKCQFCGKEYLYDMKICHSCEEKAITSGLNSQDRNDHKWRCDNFLEQSALPFGRRIGNCDESGLKLIECPQCGEEYSYGRTICHTCEGTSLPFGKIFEPVQRTYRWNCNTAMACVELLKSNLHTVETIIKETPHREKLEKNNYEWNIFSSIKFTNVQDTERKLNYLLKFE
jgi:hypothetical protein